LEGERPHRSISIDAIFAAWRKYERADPSKAFGACKEKDAGWPLLFPRPHKGAKAKPGPDES